MARCDESGTCNCVIHVGPNMVKSGSGSPNDPLYLDAIVRSSIVVQDTPTIDLHAVGTGQAGDPLTVSADLIADLGDLVDVSSNPPSIGDVLTFQGIEWVPGPGATAAPGAIVSSGGVTVGDGSLGDPLRTEFNPRDLAAGTLGLELSAAVLDAITTAVANIAAIQAKSWKMLWGTAGGGMGNVLHGPNGYPTADSVFVIQAGTAVIASDASARATLLFPQPFPRGVITFTQSPGDWVYTYAMTSGCNLSSIQYEIRDVFGNLAPNTLHRSNFTAIGW